MIPERWKPHLAMLLQTMLMGPGYTIGSWASLHVDPTALMFLRMAGAGSIFAVMFTVMGWWRYLRFTKAEWRQILILAATGPTLNSYLYILTLRYTTPSNSSMMYALTPLAVLLASVYLMRTEKLTGRKLLAVLLALAGVSIVILSVAKEGPNARNPLLGNALGVVALGCWTYYLMASKPLMMRHNPVVMTGLMMMLAALFFAPVGLYSATQLDYEAVPGQSWFGLGYITIVNSVLSFLLIAYALRRVSSSQVSIYNNLQPAIAAVFSALWGSDRLTPLFATGGFLTIFGIFLLNRYQRQEVKQNGQAKQLAQKA